LDVRSQGNPVSQPKKGNPWLELFGVGLRERLPAPSLVPDRIAKLLRVLENNRGAPRMSSRAISSYSITDKKVQKPQKSNNAEHPPAGANARPELTDKAKTPGTGMLPDPENNDANQAPTG
jgi:hypothetical protein